MYKRQVFDVSKPLKVSSRIISDFHPLSYSINIPEVIVHSSNIGSAKIAEKFGPNIQLKYLKSLGLTNMLSLEIPELGKPQVLMDKKVLSTIKNMGDKCQEILMLASEGMSMQEIQEVTGVKSLGTVLSRLSNCRKELKGLMG